VLHHAVGGPCNQLVIVTTAEKAAQKVTETHRAARMLLSAPVRRAGSYCCQLCMTGNHMTAYTALQHLIHALMLQLLLVPVEEQAAFASSHN
jgi:hypothetical protein